MNNFLNVEAAIVRFLAKIGTLSFCQSTSEWLIPKYGDIPNVMDVIKTLLTGGFIIFQILGSRYLQLFRPLLKVLSGPAAKSVCDRRL